MNKTKILIIFILGILLGILGSQIDAKIREGNTPILVQGKLDIQSLVKTIGESINTKNIKFTNNKYDRFEEISDILETSYYDEKKIQSGAMIERAVKAFVNAIDDPYTVYMDAQQNSGFHQDLKGEQDFEGIGAMVTKKDYYVQIEEVIKGSPAFKAGLMPLDRVVMVDTGSVKDLNITEAVNKIKGPKGTEVKLMIERIKKDNTKEILEKTVTRDKLLIPSVTSKIVETDNNNKIGYINISIIGEETENILEKEILDLKDEANLDGIILDLRGNGGGFLPVAVEILGHFVPKGKVVVTSKYKAFGDEEYTSKGYGSLEGLPIVVLMDHMTASAGEIIALALQEQVGAKLVGTTTFGKGSIQTLKEFKDDASLKYTIGKRYSPSGRNIDKEGINPDVEIEFDSKNYEQDRDDNQLEKAKEILQNMINK